MKRRADCLSAEAVVVAVEPDGTVELELDGASRCANCPGLCTWGRSAGRLRAGFRASMPLRPGDAVRVTLPADHVVATGLLLYGVPLAALLAGGALGAALTQSDLGTLSGALAAVAFALPASRGLRRRAEAMTLRRASLEPAAGRRAAAACDTDVETSPGGRTVQ